MDNWAAVEEWWGIRLVRWMRGFQLSVVMMDDMVRWSVKEDGHIIAAGTAISLNDGKQAAEACMA